MGILGILVAMIAGFVMPKNLISIDSLTYAGLYLCGFLFVCSLFMLLFISEIIISEINYKIFMCIICNFSVTFYQNLIIFEISLFSSGRNMYFNSERKKFSFL